MLYVAGENRRKVKTKVIKKAGDDENLGKQASDCHCFIVQKSHNFIFIFFA